MHPFELGAFFFGGVELDDAGAGPPAPMDRRISNEQVWKATTDYVSSAVEAERLGYDSFWTTEHHFQHEGYEVDPERDPAVDVDRRPHVADPPRHDVQRRAAVEPAAPGRGLLDAAQPVGRPRHPRRRARHRAPRGAPPQRQGGVDRLPRQPRPGRRRRPQPAGLRGVDGHRADGARRGDVLLPGRVLPAAGPRHPRPRQHRAAPHPGAAAAAPVRDLAGRHQPADAGVRARRRPRRRVLEPAPRLHQALLGHLRRALRRRPRRAGAGRPREADARHRGARRGHPREGGRDGDARPRRVLEVPRPVRLEPRLHGRRRQAGAGRADPDARPVDREQDDPRRHARGGRRGHRLLPRPARPAAPDDLPPPPRRPVQEGRRADGPLQGRGPAARLRPDRRRTRQFGPGRRAGRRGTSTACGRRAGSCIRTGVWQMRQGRPVRRYT